MNNFQVINSCKLTGCLLLTGLFPVVLFAGDWNQLRGPNGQGHAEGAQVPTTWSETENITWKTEIPGTGWSSPVISEGVIWVTSALDDGHSLRAIAVEAESGNLLHNIEVFTPDEPAPINDQNSFASPTPVVEPGFVYVHFGTMGTACLDSHSGKIIWKHTQLQLDHKEGPGSSPILFEDLLLINCDGMDVQYVTALDKRTGETVWKTDRSVDYSEVPIHQRKAYTMPVLVPRGEGEQLVSPGGRAIYAYNPDSGEELWRIQHRGWSIAPRPVYGHGMVFVVMDHDHPELWAVQPDGTGDVTESHISWKEKKGIPSRASPLLVEDLLYMVNRTGIVSCMEAETGKRVWKKRLPGKYSASPIYANGRIYFFNESGVGSVIETGRKFKKVAVNRLPEEPLMASPAVTGNSLIVRTEHHLYRIEEAK